MTALELIKRLRDGLSEAVTRFKLPTQYSQARAAQVYALELPTTDVLDENIYPLVVVELIGVEYGADAVATVLLTCGTYKAERGGVTDCVILTEAVADWLRVNKLVGAASLLTMELAMVESDSDFFSYGQILTQYKILKLENNYMR